jgi:hypothetical protein
MEGLRAYSARRLVRLLEDAHRTPFARERVLLNRREATGLIDTILEVRTGEGCNMRPERNLAAVTEQVRLVLQDQYFLPFTHQVSLPAETALDLADALRAVLAPAPAEF